MSEPAPPLPDHIGPYRILAKLGEGGMGAVYAAEHTKLAARVALKVLHGPYAQSPEAVARFVTEARASARIGNPHIIEVRDLGELPGGGYYLVMELLEGRSLAQALEQDGPFSVERALHLLTQLCDALGAAHARGIVHRDLKPENLFLVARDGDPDFVKVLDFGISKVLDEAWAPKGMTRTGAMLGTPYYMAPEQVHGVRDIDARADVYALGVIAFELLSGTRPFRAETFPALVLEITQTPAPDLAKLRPGLPPALVRAVHAALAKRREDRPASCAAWRAMLTAEAPAGGLAGPALLVATALVAGGAIAFFALPKRTPRATFARPTTTATARPTPTTRPLERGTATHDARAEATPVRPASSGSIEAPSAPTATATPPPRPSPLDARAAPLREEPSLWALAQRWYEAVVAQQGRGALDEVYAPAVRFRTLAHATPASVARYWQGAFANGATLDLDLERSAAREELEDEEPRARATCWQAEEAEGPVFKLRLWLTETSAARASAVGCATLEGIYVLRARRIAGALRVCHETWSLREGVCASCPTAPACATRDAP